VVLGRVGGCLQLYVMSLGFPLGSRAGVRERRPMDALRFRARFPPNSEAGAKSPQGCAAAPRLPSAPPSLRRRVRTTAVLQSLRSVRKCALPAAGEAGMELLGLFPSLQMGKRVGRVTSVRRARPYVPVAINIT